MNDQNGRYARLRYTATGALAALAQSARSPAPPPWPQTRRAKTRGHAAVANGAQDQDADVPGAGQDPRATAGLDQPFLTAVQQLVNDGTISTTRARPLIARFRPAASIRRRSHRAGSPTQLQAVEQTLENTKRALAPGVTGAPRTAKHRRPQGPVPPVAGNLLPAAAGKQQHAK